LADNDHGTARLQSPIDGEDRLAAVRRLSSFPVLVVASQTVDAALANWQEQTRVLVATAALSAVVFASILFLIVRRLSLQHEAARQRVIRDKQRLDTAVDNMSQGLLL